MNSLCLMNLILEINEILCALQFDSMYSFNEIKMFTCPFSFKLCLFSVCMCEYTVYVCICDQDSIEDVHLTTYI